MPVFIFEPNALNKIVEVEGENFVEFRSKSGIYSFEAFLEEWERLDKNRDFRSSRPEFSIDTKDRGITNAAIYGLYGWNRYVVLNNGEIAFLELLARNLEDIERAKKVGFRIR